MNALIGRARRNSLDADGHEVEEIGEVLTGFINQFKHTLSISQLCDRFLVITFYSENPQLHFLICGALLDDLCDFGNITAVTICNQNDVCLLYTSPSPRDS